MCICLCMCILNVLCTITEKILSQTRVWLMLPRRVRVYPFGRAHVYCSLAHDCIYTIRLISDCTLRLVSLAPPPRPQPWSWWPKREHKLDTSARPHCGRIESVVVHWAPRQMHHSVLDYSPSLTKIDNCCPRQQCWIMFHVVVHRLCCCPHQQQ